MKASFLSLFYFAVVTCGCATTPTKTAKNFTQSESPIAPGVPFDSYSTKDSYGRTINYYVSSESKSRLPLYLFVAGSGCESNFWKKEDGTISNGYQGHLLKTLQGKGHVMVVEKPGVHLFDSTPNPGTAEYCSKEFNEQHSLDRWAAALSAAINSASLLPQVESAKIVSIGHSEGAISVAKLSTVNSKVSHVVLLSGNGANQLFEFIVNRSPQEIGTVYRNFDFISSHPTDTSTMFWGHPSQRWASFMTESTSDLLMKTGAKVFVAHGTLDNATPIASFDFLISDLKRKGRQVTFDRLENANHSLNLPYDKSGDGMRREFAKIISWIE